MYDFKGADIEEKYMVVSFNDNLFGEHRNCFRYDNEDKQASVFIRAPQIEVQLQEELKRNVNILIGQAIFEKFGITND